MADAKAGRKALSRWLVVVTAALLLVCAAGAVGWAASEVLRPPAEARQEEPFTFVTIREGEVGSSLNLTVSANWSKTIAGTNRAQGTVTEVVASAGSFIDTGQTLFTVDLRPVVVAAGDVPAFRAIGDSAEGEDVAQLQRLLGKLGFYGGSDDGKAGPGTVAAIRAWQKSEGVEVTGSVPLGDVIFVPALPARISLSDDVQRGKVLSGGEAAVSVYETSPTFILPVTQSQESSIPIGTEVRIKSPDGSLWELVASDRETDSSDQSVKIKLGTPGGGSVCGDRCDQIPVTGETRLSATVVTLPAIQGLTIPSAALVTDEAGKVYVLKEDGERVLVTVLESAQGMSVIDGVNDGMRVRLPAVGSAP